MRSAERPPCRVFCHLGLEMLHGFLTMRFGVRCLRQEIGAVLNIKVFYGCEQQKRKPRLVADALQRELSCAGVRFAASFDLDGAAAESAHSEGVKGAENVEGAEGTRPSKMAKAPTPLHQRPLNRRFLNRRFPLRRVMPTWYSSAFCDKGSCSPAVQHFSSGPCGKARFSVRHLRFR